MVDQKLTELTALTTIVGTDILYVVKDPSGTPLSRKITRDDFLSSAGVAFGDFNYDFIYNRLRIKNPAASFYTTIVNGAIGANYNLTIPTLTANSIIQVLELAQTITGAKTFGAAGDVGKLILAGSTSGTTILNAAATAGSGTVVLPTTGTLATLAGTETFTNKLLSDSTVKFANVSDATKLMLMSLGGMTANKTVTLTFTNPLDSTITFPTATSTLATLSLAETFDGKTLTSLVRAANAITAITPASSIDLDFSTNEIQTLANGATAALTITTSNKAAGRSKTLIIVNGGTAITSFPSLPAWVFLGAAAPTGLAANKTGVFTLICTGTTDASIVGAYSAQT